MEKIFQLEYLKGIRIKENSIPINNLQHASDTVN